MNSMEVGQSVAPESTAVRVALWRALHLEVDAQPPVFDDAIGLKLIAPDASWRERPDMHPQGTAGYRASIVGRARWIDDAVAGHDQRGVDQYVILGAGLDTFALRRPDVASRMQIYEVDQAGPQQWKRERLIELGLGMPEGLHFVPVDFEVSGTWWSQLQAAGFDVHRPSIVASTGVSMYLSREAIAATLRQTSTLAPGSTFAMTFLLPLDLIEDSQERAQHEAVYARARAAGTPFMSFFRPEEMMSLARECGFKEAAYVSSADIAHRYFSGRSDGLKPASGEGFVVATT